MVVYLYGYGPTLIHRRSMFMRALGYRRRLKLSFLKRKSLRNFTHGIAYQLIISMMYFSHILLLLIGCEDQEIPSLQDQELNDFMITDHSLISDLDWSSDLEFEITDLGLMNPDMYFDTTLRCEVYETTPEDILLESHDLPEASGLTFSRLHSHVIWSHNDSGSEPILFALSDKGEILGELRLDYPTEDLEDIASSDCPHRGGYCLWVGDIGDNQLDRDVLSILLVVEPLTGIPFAPINLEFGHESNSFIRIPFILEDGPADIEALAVHHSGTHLWFFEKTEADLVRVWELEISNTMLQENHNGTPSVARLLTSFLAPGIPVNRGTMVTAADLSPNGSHLLIRVYTGIYEYRLDRPYDLSNLLNINPSLITLGPLSEPQGEALCYGWQGGGIWSISESPQEPQALHFFSCLNE